MSVFIKSKSIKSIASFIKISLSNQQQDYTSLSIRKAIFLLAIPMILEMCMESLFAVVDIFFVGKLGSDATATVGLTESVLNIIYSIAFGISMATTAMVARRVGEKNTEGAAKSGAQAMLFVFCISALVSISGLLFAPDILALMGATKAIILTGTTYIRIMLGGNIVIMLLFLLNGIFRGAGNASIAMRSLWVANICNIIFCPIFIHQFGLKGAAIATTVGRSIGVCYQLYNLIKGKGLITITIKDFLPDKKVLKNIIKVASTGTLQFLIGSASWIAMARFMTDFGSEAIAGYTIAIRWIVFFILPAFGLSNAAATLVGQNLGAGQPERAEQSVWKTAKYNAIFMAFVSIIFIAFAKFFVEIINKDPAVVHTAVLALRIISLGYIFYGIGMVMMNAFNGAGDTKTVTWNNLFWFWAFQIPFAYLLAIVWHFGPKGVFIAIVTTETCITITSVLLFRTGKWKRVKI